MKADVVKLIDSPAHVCVLGGREVEVKRVDIVQWYALNAIKQAILSMCEEPFGWLEATLRLGDFFKVATGTSSFDILLSEALVAIPALWHFNELRYIDPAVMGMSSERASDVFEEGLDNASLVDIVVTLASRFSMKEIRKLSPEFAFLAWQRIVDEQASLKTAIFYSTELGYDRTPATKDGKYKLRPKDSPYASPWQEARIRGARIAEQEWRRTSAIPQSPFIKHPDRVIDKRRRSESDGTETIH